MVFVMTFQCIICEEFRYFPKNAVQNKTQHVLGFDAITLITFPFI